MQKPIQSKKQTLRGSVGGYHLEMDGGRGGGELLLTGVLRIEALHGDEIVLFTRGGRIYIHGQMLKLSVYGGGGAMVRGKIGEVKLTYEAY